MPDRVALIGSTGQLGNDLVRVFDDVDLVPLTHSEFEICDPDAPTQMLRRVKPSVVINTSAYHQVDECEDHIERSFDVNAFGPRRVAEACRDAGAVLVHLSTDYVFGGARTHPWLEDDRPHPLNVYGASKVAGEHLVRSATPRYFVVRGSGLYGVAGSSGKGGNFIETMLRLAEGGKPIKVVADQVLSPTYTRHLAEKIRELLDTDAYGLYHVTNAGSCSWFEFAQRIFEQVGVSPDLSPTTTAEFGARATRPEYSVLGHGRLREIGRDDLPEWPDALAAYLKEKGHI